MRLRPHSRPSRGGGLYYAPSGRRAFRRRNIEPSDGTAAEPLLREALEARRATLLAMYRHPDALASISNVGAMDICKKAWAEKVLR